MRVAILGSGSLGTVIGALMSKCGKQVDFCDASEEQVAALNESKMPLYKKIWGQHVKLKASMLQDLEKGHRSEIDYINGLICSKGREYGVPTPFNDKVVELVHEAQKERSVNVFDSLSRFDELVAEHAKNVTVIL